MMSLNCGGSSSGQLDYYYFCFFYSYVLLATLKLKGYRVFTIRPLRKIPLIVVSIFIAQLEGTAA